MPLKHTLIVLISLGLIVISGWGLWVWSGKSQSNAVQNRDKTQNLEQTEVSDSPELVQAGSEEARGLSVTSGSSATFNLGQLTPNTDNTGNTSSTESAAAKMLDPKTFSQYEEYKDNTTALFAELQKGTGAELTPNKKAAVYYKGWLTDGTLFDMSRADDKGQLQPLIFTLGASQVISGWEQALAGMKVGGVRFVIVPPSVGYGTSGQGPIPSNAVLIFQVQLLAVE